MPSWWGVNQECKKTGLLREFHFWNGLDRLHYAPHSQQSGLWWLNNNLGRLYVVLSFEEMCILFYLLFPRFCIISKQGPMHPLFSFGTCIWFDNFILQKLLFIVFRNSTAAQLACIFPFSAPSRMHFTTESHILENITAHLPSPPPSLHPHTFQFISKFSWHLGVIMGSLFPSHSLLIVSCFPNLLFFPRKYS